MGKVVHTYAHTKKTRLGWPGLFGTDLRKGKLKGEYTQMVYHYGITSGANRSTDLAKMFGQLDGLLFEVSLPDVSIDIHRCFEVGMSQERLCALYRHI